MAAFSGNFTNDVDLLQQELRVKDSFDLVTRDPAIGGRSSFLVFIDGFAQEAILTKILQYLIGLKADQLAACADLTAFMQQHISLIETAIAEDSAYAVKQILSGMAGLMIDGLPGVLLMDVRQYPARSVEEPEDDRVLRGSHDGFGETLIFNAALLRRRIRDPQLTLESIQIGERSHTDIALCYMADRAKPEMLKRVREKLRHIRIPALAMSQESLAECLLKRQWYNPFPRIRYTERPDCASASVLEGSIIVLTDNTPAAMILPTSLFDFFQDTNSYYFPPLVGSYLHLVRGVMSFLNLFLTPVWYLFVINPHWLPQSFEFIRIAEPNSVPVLAQFLAVEFILDAIRLASLNTPGSLSNAFGVVGALLLGEFAITAGFFVSEVLLYMAFVSIGHFTQPSHELAYAFKLSRVLLLVLTACFGWWGFGGGVLLLFLVLLSTETPTGRHYLYPLIPFNGKALFSLAVRRPISRKNSGG